LWRRLALIILNADRQHAAKASRERYAVVCELMPLGSLAKNASQRLFVELVAFPTHFCA
jgi:hypothetical protein